MRPLRHQIGRVKTHFDEVSVRGSETTPSPQKEFPFKAMWAEKLRMHHTLPKPRYLEQDFEDIKGLMSA